MIKIIARFNKTLILFAIILLVISIVLIVSKNSPLKLLKNRAISGIDYDFPYYGDRVTFFEINGIQADVVMLGDSITDRSEWHELFNDVLIINRGIGKDTTSGVLNRLETIISRKPAKVFIMIGINDINHGYAPHIIFENYKKITDRLIDNGINTYMQSVLFTHGRIDDTNDRVFTLNALLQDHADTSDLLAFVDLNHRLSKSNILEKVYSTDGVHLNGLGYRIWAEEIDRYIRE